MLIHENTSTHNDIRARIAKGRSGFKTLQSFWKNSNITAQWKLKVFKMCFVPMLTYGMESASITPSDHRALIGFQAQCIRSIYGIKSTYYTKVLNPQATAYTHMQVIQQAKMPTITAIIHKAQLKFLGHVLRTNFNSHPIALERDIVFSKGMLYRGGLLETSVAEVFPESIGLTKSPS